MTDTTHGKSDIRPVDLPALISFVLLLGVVFLQFFTRYVLNDSPGWTEEISRYLLIATAYLGSITAIRKGEHIFLELLYRRAPAGNAKTLAVFSELLGVAYHLGLAILAFTLAVNTDQRMVSIDAPKSLVYGIVSAAMFSTTWYSAKRLMLRLGQTNEHILESLESEVTGISTHD